MHRQYNHDLGRPRMGVIKTAVRYSGLSRTRLYELAGIHSDLFRKLDKRVLVDFAVLDQILDDLPLAQIKPRPVDKRDAERVSEPA